VLYNALFALLYPVMVPYFLFRMCRRGGYLRDFAHRFALYGRGTRRRLRGARRIWIHAVSVGEVHVALRLMQALRERRPGLSFVMTTTTSTGHRIAEDGLHADDVLLYFPIDFPFIVRRALRSINPLALLLTEGELWPNLVRLTRRRAVPVVVVNGRMSPKSFKGYARLSWVFRPVFSLCNAILVQSRVDAERFLSVGAPTDRVKVLGSAKYDVALGSSVNPALAGEVLRSAGYGQDTVFLMGGSTWDGEEAALVRSFKRVAAVMPRVRLVLIPRHFERAAEVAAALEAAGVTYLRRSMIHPPARAAAADPSVLLVDSTGELRSFYEHASVIFVGKSLTQHGGQNVIEPATAGKAVIVGPNMENFPGIMDDFLRAEAIIQVADEAGLDRAVGELLADADRRAALGARARAVVERGAGAVPSTVDTVLSLLPADAPAATR
jgi:3-deoxy-D-manno-octulosonic-acid transferase